MAIVTTADVKTALAISGADQDDQIAALITHAFEWIQDYCNDDFDTFDDGLNLPIIRMIGVLLQNPGSVSSERIGDYGYVFATTEWPKNILTSLKPYRQVLFV